MNMLLGQTVHHPTSHHITLQLPSLPLNIQNYTLHVASQNTAHPRPLMSIRFQIFPPTLCPQDSTKRVRAKNNNTPRVHKIQSLLKYIPDCSMSEANDACRVFFGYPLCKSSSHAECQTVPTTILTP